jgi:NAD+ kinase
VRVGFILRKDKPEAVSIASELAAWLLGRGCDVVIPTEAEGIAARETAVPEDQLASHCDLLVVLGGDGTLLHASALVGDTGVPVLGINLGRLGFLTPFTPAEAQVALAAALDGKLAIEDRMRLRVRLVRADGKIHQRVALNDAVISQSALARLVELDASLDGNRITVYRADGLIVATPTGSTAYNLAAGGPILTPGQESLAITPICPHTLTNRPLVVPASSRMEVTLGGDSRSVLLTVDGQWGQPFLPGDRVELSRAASPLRVYRSDKSYFEILREKLHWGRAT